MKGVLDSLAQTLFSTEHKGVLKMFCTLYDPAQRMKVKDALQKWKHQFGKGLRTQGKASRSGDYYARGLQQGITVANGIVISDD